MVARQASLPSIPSVLPPGTVTAPASKSSVHSILKIVGGYLRYILLELKAMASKGN